MSADSQWPVQEAIHDALVGDTTLQTLVGTRVYDAVPDDATYPYVTIGDADATEWDTKNSFGMDQMLHIHTWSRYRGQREAKLIMSAIHGALHNQPLTVDGHDLISLRFSASFVVMDPDGLTRHGVSRFRAITDLQGDFGIFSFQFSEDFI